MRTRPSTDAQSTGIAVPTLVVADHDDLVSLEHTIERGTSHLVAMEKPDVVNRLILDFIQNDPAPTMMPIRGDAPGAHGG